MQVCARDGPVKGKRTDNTSKLEPAELWVQVGSIRMATQTGSIGIAWCVGVPVWAAALVKIIKVVHLVLQCSSSSIAFKEALVSKDLSG